MPPPRGVERQIAAGMAQREARAAEAAERRLQSAMERTGRIRDRNSTEYIQSLREQDRALTQLTHHEEERERQLVRSRSALNQGLRNAGRDAGAQVQQTLAEVADSALQRIMANAQRAQQALLQTHRRSIPDVGTYTNVLGEYTSMLDNAMLASTRYGMATDDVLAVQHQFIQSMNIDVAAGGFAQRISDATDAMAYFAVRTGQSIQEVEQFASVALSTFGRGGEAQIEAYSRTMRSLAQIPTLLAESAELAGMELGNVFANPQFAQRVQEWTNQFGDQAASIMDMATAMGKFSVQAARAGHSTRSINNMQQGMAQGLMADRRGWDVNEVRAGQILQRRIAADPQMLNRIDERLRAQGGEGLAPDRTLINDLASGDSGVNAADLHAMLAGTAEGMDAMMEGLVGVGQNQNVSIIKQLLMDQGFDTGNDRDQLRLAQLVRERGQGNMINQDEMAALITQATEREQGNRQAERDQYLNIGLTAEATQAGTRALMSLDNTTKGILAVVGGTALFAQQELDNAESARGLVANVQEGEQGRIRERFQEWRDAGGINTFDAGEAQDRNAMLQQLAIAKRNLDARGFTEVMANLQQDLGLDNNERDTVNRDLQLFMLRQERTQIDEQARETRNPQQRAAPAATPTPAATVPVQSLEPPQTPVTVPAAARPQPAPTTPAATGTTGRRADASGNTGTAADPLRPVQPGTMRVASNGDATIALEFDIRQFNIAVQRSQMINATSASTGANNATI